MVQMLVSVLSSARLVAQSKTGPRHQACSTTPRHHSVSALQLDHWVVRNVTAPYLGHFTVGPAEAQAVVGVVRELKLRRGLAW